MTADPGTRPGGGPPITEGQLIGLFRHARADALKRSGDLDMLTGGALARFTASTALQGVLRRLATEVDADTFRQLGHIFGALESMITALGPPEAEETAVDAGPEELSPGVMEWGAKKLGINFKAGSKYHRGEMLLELTGATQADGPDLLDALEEALDHVEKAFDRSPEPVAAPPPPWYEDKRRLFETIAGVLGVAAVQGDDETWQPSVNLLMDALRQEDIEARFYDPGADELSQARLFHVVDSAMGPDGRYVTHRPALVTRGSDGEQVVLIEGDVERLPVKGEQ